MQDQDIEELTEHIFCTRSVDFRKYVKSSLGRRFQRLMTINGLNSVDQLKNYIDHLSDVNTLIEGITVNTTEMFRDPSFWNLLRKQVFPMIGSGKNFRIWHAGCSSGEEVISLQVLLH